MDTSLRIKQVLIILLTASFAFQRSVSAASVRAGLSDILIGILFGYVCISFIFTGKKSLFPLPPVYVLLSICAVVLSGAVASYSGGGMGILKEEIQTIEILGIG